MNLVIQMNNSKLLYRREAYTLFNILEDFGGFTGSIVMVFSFLMSFYSELVYKDSISGELPLQASSFSDKTRQNVSTFIQKFAGPDS